LEVKELQGRRIVLTRTLEQSQRLAHALETLGAEVVLLPAIEILVPENWDTVDEALRSIERYDWIVFTSANGVAGFLTRYDQLFASRHSLAQARIGVVGPATRRQAESELLTVTLQPTGSSAQDLAVELTNAVDRRGQRVLFATSNIGRDVIPDQLRRAGWMVDVIEVYRTESAGLETKNLRLQLKTGIDDVVFASPSAVRSFVKACLEAGVFENLRRARVTCIGSVTAAAARELELNVQAVAGEPTVERVVQAIVSG
jgi:uroporphyrinogen III methyltransferase/synthase